MVMSLSRLFLPMLLLATIAGCQVSAPNVVYPLLLNTDEPLQADEGYLFFEIDTSHNLHQIFLSGVTGYEIPSNSLHTGKRFIMLKVKAGDYFFRQVTRQFSLYSINYFDLPQHLWQFQVKPQKICYVGSFYVDMEIAKSRVNRMLINKSTPALESLMADFPTVLDKHGVDYCGPGEDEFFNVVGADKPGFLSSNKTNSEVSDE